MMQARGEYRPNTYNTPNPRPVMPTSGARMLKPGFSATSTLYVPPKSRRKAPTPPPKEIIVPEYPFISSFLFTDKELLETPSKVQHEISAEDELRLRRIGTLFIRDIVKKLNEPQFCTNKNKLISKNAMSVAFIIFHRFYMYHSFGTFDPLDLATAALFLAAKCEECPRRMLDFSILLYHAKHPKDNVKLNSREATDMNNLITTLETCIIRTLAFELKIEPPHVTAVKALKPQIVDSDILRKMAFRLSTDALMFTDLCLRYSPEVIGAAMLLVASIFYQRDLKEEVAIDWYKQVSPDCTEEIVYAIAKVFSKALEEIKPILYAERKPDAASDEPLVDDFEEAATSSSSIDISKDKSTIIEKDKHNTQTAVPDKERRSVSQVKEERVSKEKLVVPKMPPPLTSPYHDREYLKRKEYSKNGHPPVKHPRIEEPVHHKSHVEKKRHFSQKDSSHNTHYDKPVIYGIGQKLPPPVERLPYHKNFYSHHSSSQPSQTNEPTPIQSKELEEGEIE